MNARVIVALVAASLLSPTLAAEWGTPCNTTVTIDEMYVRIISIARCSWETGGVQNNSVTIDIHHTVTPGPHVDVCEAAGYCGTMIEFSPYEASTTYTSTAKIAAEQLGLPFEERTETASDRTKDPVRPRDEADICYTQPWRCDPRYFECPLVIQTADGPWQFTTVDGGVAFDLDADGRRERTAWTAAGSALAFLAMDRNGNGAIDDGRELFGEQGGAANGFVALAEFDTNGDRIIDPRDAVWPRLLLWRDANHDGLSQSDELQAVHASAFRELSTRHHALERRDANGNVLRYQSLLRTRAGEARPYYDVYLRTDSR